MPRELRCLWEAFVVTAVCDGKCSGSVWSPPRVALDVVVSAVDQFITFACGSLIARTRAQSPARLLVASPSIIEQFGREWVVCCCREVVFTVSGGIKGGTARDLDHEAHVWMRLSPTLGVVRSGVFETFGESDGDNRLVGFIGEPEIQPGESSVSGKDHPIGTGKERMVMMRRVDGGVLVDLVDGRGSEVKNLFPGDGTLDPIVGGYNTRVYCNRRWIVLMNYKEIRLWNTTHSEALSQIELDCQCTLGVTFCKKDPDVLLVVHTDFLKGSVLWHIDLKESFQQSSIVLKKEPVPLPLALNQATIVLGGDPICVFSQGDTSQCQHMHNTSTNSTLDIQGSLHVVGTNTLALGRCLKLFTRTSTSEFQVFNTSDINTPLIVFPFERQIPCSTATADSGSITTVTMLLPCGIVVWECTVPPKSATMTVAARYMITDAETDTLVAFMTYHR
ncbi:hypothetical protein Pelo_18445 [Pelomyxa schiedti]|nr:hypothetical protein Pelo_18445 [Pelomyxa schiedti]